MVANKFETYLVSYILNLFCFRLYRAYYEAKSNIIEMWKGNPALASVLFGLPFGFFALICYSICCADIMDAEEDDDEEEQTLAAASRATSGGNFSKINLIPLINN